MSRGLRESRDPWIMDLRATFVAQVSDQPAEYGMYRWAGILTELAINPGMTSRRHGAPLVTSFEQQ